MRESKFNDINELLEVLASPVRLDVLRALSNGDMGYTDLIKAVRMDKDRDSGKFSYHLKRLLSAGLICFNTESKTYHITNTGTIVLEQLSALERRISSSSENAVLKADMSVDVLDKLRIAESLIKEGNVPAKVAYKIATEVERRIKSLKLDSLSTHIIREIVSVELLENGLEKYHARLTRLGLSVNDFTNVLRKAMLQKDSKVLSREVTKKVISEYVLNNLLPSEVKKFCVEGLVKLYNLDGWLTDVMCVGVKFPSERLTSMDHLRRFCSHLCENITHEFAIFLSEPSSRVSMREVLGLNGPLFLNVKLSREHADKSLGLIGGLEEGLGKGYSKVISHSLEFMESPLVSLPVREGDHVALAYSEDDALLYSYYGMLPLTGYQGGIVIGVIGINVVRLLLNSEKEQEEIRDMLKDIVAQLYHFLRKRRNYIERLHALSSSLDSIRYLYLLAPIGIYEASTLLVHSKAREDEILGVMKQLLKTMTNVVALYGNDRELGLRMVSAWSESLSERSAKDDLAVVSSRSSKTHAIIKAIEGKGSYISKALPDELLVKTEALRELSRFFEGGIIIDIGFESLGRALSSLKGEEGNFVLRVKLPASP